MNILKNGKWIIGFNELSNEKEKNEIPWKIDSFRYKKNDKKINFIYEIKEFLLVDKINNMNKTQIYKEYNGFYHYIATKDKRENTFITLKRSNSEEIILSYKINPEWDNWQLVYDITKTNGRYAFEFLMRIFSFSVLNHGGIVLHGVLMEHNGKGIIISAPSGTGKTTHARMWRDNENALIINGDRALCGKDDDSGKWTGYGMPWCGTSGEYINRKVPISAIIVLERNDENSVEKLDVLNGFIHMLPNVTAPVWEESMMNKAMDMLQDMVENIPVYKLKCRPDLDAVKVLKSEIDKL